jgi:prepilin peptidase CpaA
MPSAMSAAAAILPILTVWAGALDVFTRSIPNVTVSMLGGGFLIFAAAAGFNVPFILAHAACAIFVLGVSLILYFRKLIGGGDAKLLACAALWFGFENLLAFLTWTALSAGALAVAFLIADAASPRTREYTGWSGRFPFGAAIAAGALIVFPDWFVSFH